jgi:mannosyltransferase OCH1-like enzyme
MVVLRLGGVYADIDVECRQPLDSVIQPADTLLVGWDAELPDTAAAATQQYARQRQIATWFFAAAPGHPVLRQLCDHIARNAMTVFSNNTVRDTLERTGQGIWTDLVLRHALQHPVAKVRVVPCCGLRCNIPWCCQHSPYHCLLFATAARTRMNTHNSLNLLVVVVVVATGMS